MRLRRRQPGDAAELANAAVQLIEAFTQGDRHALTYVDSVGVIEYVAYKDVARKAPHWAEILGDHGVQPGDRVVVLAGPDRAWRTALLGVLHAGGVAVPCPAATPVAEIRAIAADAGAVVFVSAEARPDLAGPEGPTVLFADQLNDRNALRDAPLPHETTTEDAALILYSQGASGLQAAMHTHGSLLARAKAAAQRLGLQEGERVWSTTPDGSVESIWLLLGAWHNGAEVVDVEQALEPEEWHELLERFRPAVVWFSDDEYAELASEAPEWVVAGRSAAR